MIALEELHMPSAWIHGDELPFNFQGRWEYDFHRYRNTSVPLMFWLCQKMKTKVVARHIFQEANKSRLYSPRSKAVCRRRVEAEYWIVAGLVLFPRVVNFEILSLRLRIINFHQIRHAEMRKSKLEPTASQEPPTVAFWPTTLSTHTSFRLLSGTKSRPSGQES